MTLLGHKGVTAVFKNRYPSGLPAPLPVGFVMGFSCLGTVEGKHLGRRKEDLGTMRLEQNSCSCEREGRWPQRHRVNLVRTGSSFSARNKDHPAAGICFPDINTNIILTDEKKKGGGGRYCKPQNSYWFCRMLPRALLCFSPE